MPTDISQSILDELSRILTEACEKGDNVSAIAKRSHASRQLVSRLKNGSYPQSPSLETAEAIAKALGYSFKLSKATAVSR